MTVPISPIHMACLAAFTLLVSLGIAQETKLECDVDSMLQVNSIEQKEAARGHPGGSWQSPADIASLPRPKTIYLMEKVELTIISAVPTFGPDGNFITLIREPVLVSQDHTASNALEAYLLKNTIYCTGPKRSHRVLLRWSPAKVNLFCDWPAEEAKETKFEIFLEDAAGKALGQFSAKHKPLEKKFDTVACVRDIFVDTNPRHLGESFSGPFKQLVEWLEFNHMHGIDHFFFYTFHGTEDAAKEIMTPYMNDGLASRIHFEHYPGVNVVRQHYVIRDCLYRAKNHANWLLPTIDVDEYIHMTGGHIFAGGVVPKDYLRTAWDSIVRYNKAEKKKIQTIKFYRFRFARGPPGQLDIASVWREASLQEGRSGHIRALPKYVCNVHLSYDPHIHGAMFSSFLGVGQNVLVANHYRNAKGVRIEYGDNFTQLPDALATVKDEALVPSVALVEEAIRQRFSEDPRILLRRLGEKRPPSQEVAAKLSADPGDVTLAMHSLKGEDDEDW